MILLNCTLNNVELILVDRLHVESREFIVTTQVNIIYNDRY